ncbi:peptide deformylase [Candidatus Daviesbacteria bacterium RIFCSPHIGHO2_01_FULL_44_29]|uniref:Peptide deformylase n=1 Tax=Candidatus Daviesbacteria bacterium RIFCSPHIGHO2_02_FULL_43_12 TaxID=1797776 RepID=A0A1F5KKZ7_9BACT|nr:MAG: peptide deformylase [Candidatus Daviesbacteria bacterium RIFCSPHIGHO2_01_FULL_44_29]OGE39684.1 MAG: peptide deformylase [Candidatus Daviesbacteria bacterium RIFCSPHIGHO2_12_FULL_47_45]OGE41544.1 MAG: peptide deformylase [Candidatus Daviesbacteria bacterium RIFCSPHIGHO2_02_FULL_43_12]OGE69826.1 MAG: peptide deformylase [Candidatus Daviesbacteria bacterium RIFCSPLOWO2_01_FULL_43_15]
MFKIVKAPNNILRSQAKLVKKVTPALMKVISEMIETAKSFTDPEGVGLAATQIGKDEQFFIAKLENHPHLLGQTGFVPVFNPTIIWFSKRYKVSLEGCLSIPDYYGEVARPIMVKVIYMNSNGQTVKETLRGVNAMIFQHEYDHLHGRLFIDYVLSQKSRLFKVTGKDKTGADIFEEVAL